MKIGFIGLGNMGHYMSKNLYSKFDNTWPIAGYDTIPERMMHPWITPQDSVEGVAHFSDTIFLSLPGAEEVSEVVNRINDSFSLRTIVNMSTSGVENDKRLSNKLSGRNILVDAPVSGGVEGAKNGSLSIMVGGPEETVYRLMPYLRTMGISVVHLGPVGSGQAAKCINQMIVAAAFAAIAESFAVARAAGIDLRALYGAIKDGWAGSKVLDVFIKDVLSGNYLPGGSIDMLIKDLNYAKAFADKTGCIIPSFDTILPLFRGASKKGYGAESQAAIFKLF